MKDNKKEFDESIVEDTGSAVDIEIEDGDHAETEKEEAKAAEEPASEAAEMSGDETVDESGRAKASNSEKEKKKSARVLEAELKKAEAKTADMTDRYQRLMAEFENARKRMDKEKSQMFDIGARAVLEKLLPVVDNFERGLEALSEEEKQDPFVQGIEKIYQQLMTAFTDLGVTAMDAAGKAFNPDLHNAVMHVEDEELGENIVTEEFQKGYMYKDSVLRHSMVKVAN